MTPRKVTHSTFSVERDYPKPPEHVFTALSDPAKKRRWFAESDQHEIRTYESDFRIGGAERLSYLFNGDTPVKGMIISTEGRFEVIVPNQRVVTSSAMWIMDACISASLVTMELLPSAAGTHLLCTFQGAFFENSDGPQHRERGWQALLDKLGRSLT